MRGQDRMHIGKAHEFEVRKRLGTEDWDVQEWGNGLLDDVIRNVLQHQPTKLMLRWLPDLIAVRDPAIRLVDAKSEKRRDTPYFSLEIDAWSTHLVLEKVFGIPVVYVWDDFTTNRPSGLKVVRWELSPTSVDGSGTPFVLVKKNAQHAWDWAFPIRNAA